MKYYLARNLLFLRKCHKLTQADMLARIGVSRVTWSNYENAISEPDIVRLIDIANLFKVNIDDLIRIDLAKKIESPGKNEYALEKQTTPIPYLIENQEQSSTLHEENVEYKKTLKKEVDLLILTQLNVIAADVKELKEMLQ